VSPSLDGINAKLSRAEQHLNALEEAIAEFLDGGLLIGSKFDPVNKGYNVFYNGLGAGFPVGWGAILGDFIHNAGSLLDHLVWQLALINNETPDRDNHFPICATEPGFKNDVIHRNPKRGKSPLHGLGPEHVARIQSRQPYVGRTKVDAEATPLFLLNQCWNMDKHQLIHAVQPYVASDVLKVRFEPPEFRLARVEMFIAPGNLLNRARNSRLFKRQPRSPHHQTRKCSCISVYRRR
jgi:hypothetical protein